MQLNIVKLIIQCFTDLDQGREILSRFSLPKSMKHSVDTGQGVSLPGRTGYVEKQNIEVVL
jgi:hypothetical protein